MRTLTKHQIEKAKILKAARTAIRLKYSLLADKELAEALPRLSDRIDNALSVGRAFKMTPAELFNV